MKHLLLFLFLFLAKENVVAQDTILLQDNIKQTISNGKERYFFTKKALPIQQILTELYRAKDSVDLNYITGWVWVKFIIKNNSNNSRFVLHTSDGHISGLYMFKMTSDGYKMTPPQRYHPEDGREVYNRIPAFFLDIEKGETKLYYLKIEVVDEIVNFNYIIQDYAHYTQNAQTDYLIIGVFFGALLLIIMRV